jgi:hypothetical protein
VTKTIRDLLFEKNSKQPEKTEIKEISYEKHDVAPRLEIRGKSSTSGMERQMAYWTDPINKPAGYNPDLDPWQSPVLQLSNTSIKSRRVREEVFRYSEFIQKQTTRIIYDIVMRGWRITRKTGKTTTDEEGEEIEEIEPVKPDEFPTFPNDLLLAIIESVSKAVFIDTAYIALFGQDYRVFTSNDVFRPYGDAKRIPTEVYFWYPQDEAMLYEGSDKEYRSNERHYPNEKVGFLLQDCPDVKRKRRTFSSTINLSTQGERSIEFKYEGRSTKQNDDIFRECVQVTPLKSVKSVYGESLLMRQGHMALGLIYVEFLSVLRMFKGGKDRFLIYPTDAAKTYKDIMKREVRRGMLTRGTAVGYSGGKPNEVFMIEESVIPELKDEEVRKILTSSSLVSRQLTEGTPESGALGGSAPEASERIDEHTKSQYYLTLEEAIRNCYWVFYGIPRYEHETDEYTKNKKTGKTEEIKKGQVIKQKKVEEQKKVVGPRYEPAYIIEFFVPDLENPEEENLDNPGDQDQTGNNATDNKKNNNNEKPKSDMKQANSKNPLLIGEIRAKKALSKNCFFQKHSNQNVNGKDYVVYRGNIFNTGEYKYPDRGDGVGSYSVNYTVSDIKELTENPVNIKDLEFKHTNDHLSTGLGDNNYGFIKIIGFDNINNTDITDIYIEESKNQKLINEGVIKQDDDGNYHVKLSPYFVRRPRAEGGQKLLVLNTAIVDPRNDEPLSESSGLGKTSAKTK